MRRTMIPGILLLALCVVAFGGVGRNGFVNLDDGEYIVDNPMVARGLTADGLAWAFTTTRAGNWHPATWVSHMLDAELFGMDPGRQHLMSAAIHAGSALLLFFSLQALTGAAGRSALVAALFAVHPLRVESVAWASERKDVLAMLFVLLALLAHVRAVRRPGTGARFAVVGLFALALLAKPMPVSLPFALLLLDWWPLGRWMPGSSGTPGAPTATAGILPPWALWREKAPLFLLAAVSSAVTYRVQADSGAVVLDGFIPFTVRAANAVQSYAAYLGSTLWPRQLSAFYPHPVLLPPWPAGTAALLLLVAVTALAWRLSRRVPALPVGWLWYLGTLLPMIGLVQVGGQARADRYTYLPHIGIFVAAVWGFFAAVRGRRARCAAAAVGAVAVLLCAAATIAQIRYWRGSVPLFTRALELAAPAGRETAPRLSPAIAFIRNGLGLAYYDEGRLDEAIAEYRRAVADNPSYAVAMNNLALALEDKGLDVEANALYVQALALDPRFAEPRNNLGTMLLQRGQGDEAIRLFQEALAIDPLIVEAHSNLGVAYGTVGRTAEAERELRAAVALGPEYEPARFNLGKLLLEQGRPGEAADQFRESIRLAPGEVEAYALLAQAFAKAGRMAEAERAYRQALELDPTLRWAPQEPGRPPAAATPRPGSAR